jgi:zinc and cadmium transporter
LAAVAAGYVPLARTFGAHATDLFLALASGILLGAAGFHMLPESFKGAGANAGVAVVAGLLSLLLLERFVLIHICEERDCGSESHRTSTMGMAAFIGLSLHTLFDGVALGSAMSAGQMGNFIFLAILVHKMPSSFSLASILRAGGYARRSVMFMVTGFALMVPAGAALYLLVRNHVDAVALTPVALGFSAGTFLHLALSDLMPDLHRSGASKLSLSGLLVAGIMAMYGLSLADLAH